jgi:hypothetical protein
MTAIQRAYGSGPPRKITARAAAAFGVDTVIGSTGSAIWHDVAMFPPVDDKIIQEGYADFAERWNPIIDVFDDRIPFRA